MPFTEDIKREAMEKSGRYCCVCHEFAGRNINVHHIIQEADGGPNTIDNAIAVCFRCHAEAGHYNPKHPLGNKYSPAELRKHRDRWWKYCENYDDSHLNDADRAEIRKHKTNGFPNGIEITYIEKEVGTVWSNYVNEPQDIKVVGFDGKYITKTETEDLSGFTCYELYQLKNGRFVVYTIKNHRGNWGIATLSGLDDCNDKGLTIHELQDEFSFLATAAGLTRVYKFNVD